MMIISNTMTRVGGSEIGVGTLQCHCQCCPENSTKEGNAMAWALVSMQVTKGRTRTQETGWHRVTSRKLLDCLSDLLVRLPQALRIIVGPRGLGAQVNFSSLLSPPQTHLQTTAPSTCRHKRELAVRMRSFMSDCPYGAICLHTAGMQGCPR